MATTLANVDGLQVPLAFMAAAMILRVGAVGWWPGLLCMLSCPGGLGSDSGLLRLPRRGTNCNATGSGRPAPSHGVLAADLTSESELAGRGGALRVCTTGRN